MPATPAAVAAIVAAAAGGGVLVTLLAVLAHRHLSRGNVLGNATREGVFQLVKERPGVTIMDVARHADVRHTTATYHLNVLEEMGMVVSERVGNRKHYFPNGMAGPRAERLERVLAGMGRAADVVRALAAAGSARAGDLAPQIGMTAPGTLWHLKRLEELGIVEGTHHPRGRVYRVTSAYAAAAARRSVRPVRKGSPANA